MNGVELTFWFVVLALVCVSCGYIGASLRRLVDAWYTLDVGTLSYTDADTFHRKPNAVPGPDGHSYFHRDPGSVVGNPRPRTIHRPNYGDRPDLAPSGRNPHIPDAEAMK